MKKEKNTRVSKNVSAVVLALCAVLMVLTTFNFVFPIKAFFLGALGFSVYPILVFAGFFSLLVLRGKKFVYSPKYLVFLSLCFFFFVCVLQTAFTGFGAEGLGYGEYLSNCFSGLYTPGGVVVGVFAYPIFSLLHAVAGIVFYSIAFIVSLYFVVSYLQTVKDQKELAREQKLNKYKNFDTISNDIETSIKTSEEPEDYGKRQVEEEEPEEEEVTEEEAEEDDEENIFIDDSDKDLAMKRLGLSKDFYEDEEKNASQDKPFGQDEERDLWKNRMTREMPTKFYNDEVLPKKDPVLEKNKEYLKTIYSVNNDNLNPIINAEDYEDYKEKMRGYEDKQKVFFKRELDVNQTLISKSEQEKQNKIAMQAKKEDDLGIEPYKKIANDRGGFDNFESNPFVKQTDVNNSYNNQFRPQNNFGNVGNVQQSPFRPVDNQPHTNTFGQVNNNLQPNTFRPVENKAFDTFRPIENKTFDTFSPKKFADESDALPPYSSPKIEGLEDYIKPISPYEDDNAVKSSPLNPNNFAGANKVDSNRTVNLGSSQNDGIIRSTDDFKPFDTTKLSEGDVEDSLGETYKLKEQPSNVYKLPSGFSIAGQGDGNLGAVKKDAEPNLRYDAKYIRPPVDLLEKYVNEEDLTTDHQKNIEILERVLEEFRIPAKVEAVRRGSAVTRYELRMPVGIPVRKIHQHASDIALALAAPGEIRIETPIKGKSAVGIEVPNSKIDKVGFRDIIESPTFENAKKPLTFALGKDIDGTIYCCDLASMPHLLVAGSTGSGKSVCLNALILSLIYRTSPEDLRFILVDPKRVEFAIFNNLPHLLMPKAITEPKKALNAFDWLVNEMERRYTLFQECYVKNITEYNAQPEVVAKKVAKLPFIVLIVDEFADLVLTTNRKELEEKIMRLTQKARAAGIHVILATQRPNAEIITGAIKINLPSRIAFAVTSYIDSKVILDQPGAEKLLGRGDMLYSPQSGEPIRVQGCFVDTPEVKRVVEFVKEHNASFYDENVANIINSENGPNGSNGNGGSGDAGGDGGEFDSLMPDALKFVIENGQATISMLQRRFAIGFTRAARIIDQMTNAKFISGSDGSKPRSVYITMEDYEKLF